MFGITFEPERRYRQSTPAALPLSHLAVLPLAPSDMITGMDGNTALKRMTVDQFMDWDDGTDRRYELIAGVPVMMSPPLELHADLVSRLTLIIGPQLRLPCRILGGAGATIPDRTDYYFIPDLAISCAPPDRNRRTMVDPVVIVEVLSPSTRDDDRGIKLWGYRRVPSIQEVLLVWGDRELVEVHRRQGSDWLLHECGTGTSVELSSMPVAFSIAELYAGLPVDPA